MNLVPHRMPNGRLNKKQVAVASRVLDAIHAKHGCIKPRDVVAVARPASSPIHNLFTWDNTKASEKWREEEARSLIRSIRVIREEIPLNEQPVTRKFYSVEAGVGEDRFDGDAYMDIADIMANADYRSQLVGAALAALKTWKEKYDGLREFTGIYAELASLERNLGARAKARPHKRAA